MKMYDNLKKVALGLVMSTGCAVPVAEVAPPTPAYEVAEVAVEQAPVAPKVDYNKFFSDLRSIKQVIKSHGNKDLRDCGTSAIYSLGQNEGIGFYVTVDDVVDTHGIESDFGADMFVAMQRSIKDIACMPPSSSINILAPEYGFLSLDKTTQVDGTLASYRNLKEAQDSGIFKQLSKSGFNFERRVAITPTLAEQVHSVAALLAQDPNAGTYRHFTDGQVGFVGRNNLMIEDSK
jgi:hypothetical protein